MANKKLGLFFKKAIFVGGCLYSLVYLLSCLTPYFNSNNWFAFTFFGLLFPVFLAAMVLWVLIVFLFYRKKFLIFFLLIFVGYKNIGSVIAFNFSSDFNTVKKSEHIRLMTWNVQDFIDSQIYTDTPGNVRRDIFLFIKQMQPDILCLQDFSEKDFKYYRCNMQEVLKAGGFKSFVFNIDYEDTVHPHVKYGTAIFSKYPMLDSGRYKYPTKKFSESLAYVDVNVNNDTVRVFNTHLQSMYLKLQEAQEALANDFIKEEIPFLEKHRRYRERIVYYDKIHNTQANFIKPILNNCKYPFVFCADLNSVPSSYTYHTISRNLNDAFLLKGFGFGGTYDGFSPTIRIDVALTSKQFSPVQYYSPQLKISDHFPVITDLKLN